MRIKGIVAEDFVNYKSPAIFINTSFCDFKCCREQHLDTGVCQNAPLAQAPTQDVPDTVIYEKFASNPITKAVVIGGMEPLLQMDEVESLLSLFREKGDHSPFVIYTGYYPEEVPEHLARLRRYGNVIAKFGRYIPGRPSRYDEVLGVTLSSDNQFGKIIS